MIIIQTIATSQYSIRDNLFLFESELEKIQGADMDTPVLPQYNCIDFSIGNTDFQVLFTENLYLEPNVWNVYQHFHLFCECHFLKSGQAMLQIGSKEHLLDAVAFCIIPSRLRHGFRTLREPASKISFYITLSQNKNNENDTFTWYNNIFSSEQPFITQNNISYFKSIYEMAPYIASADFIQKTKMTYLFSMAFLELLEEAEELALFGNPHMPVGYEEEMILKIESFMVENFSPDAQPEDLSEYLCLGQRQTERLLKRLFNKSFLEIKNETRIEKAKEMIAQKENSLKDIAEKLGYSNYTNFYKNFKQRTNLSPEEYRESCK